MIGGRTASRQKWGGMLWAGLCFVFPPFLILLVQKGPRDNPRPMPSPGRWATRVALALGCVICMGLLGDYFGLNFALMRMEAYILSKMVGFEYVIDIKGITVLISDAFIEFPIGVLDFAFSLAGLGALFGLFIIENQPYASVKVMLLGFITGVLIRLFKDAIFFIYLIKHPQSGTEDVYFLLTDYARLIGAILFFAATTYVVHTIHRYELMGYASR